MTLFELLGLNPEEQNILSLCGSGGKTTLMGRLSAESAAFGPSSIFTTTHIFPPRDAHVCLLEPFSEDACRKAWSVGKTVAAGEFLAAERKFSAPTENTVNFLLRESHTAVIEADGSRCLPMKFPDKNREPVIRPETTAVIALLGLSALGRMPSEVFHRLELARQYMDIPDAPITEELMAKALWLGYGWLQPVFLLNQADDVQLRICGDRIAELLLEYGAQRVAVTSLQSSGIDGKIFKSKE